MHRISLPTKASKSRQNRIFILIFALSKPCCSRWVPSLPLRSKSKRRTTSDTPSCSISAVASRKDLPPVFTVKTLPLTPKSRSAAHLFCPQQPQACPSLTPLHSLAMICWIFSSFSLSLVDKRCYLVILACRTVSKQSLASLLFAK